MSVQYNVFTVLLTHTTALILAVLKKKFLGKILTFPNLTLSNHTEFKKLYC